MQSCATYFLQSVKIAWALPWTILGVLFGFVGILTGGGVRIGPSVLEFWGGAIGRMLNWLPMGEGAAAITFGHTILARNWGDLDSCREHELVHVRQYERWGLLFIPAYLSCSLVLWLLRKSPYLDNPFEREAYGAPDMFSRRVHLWLSRRISVLLVASLCGLLMGSLGRLWWVCELASHFRLVYLLALLLVALLWWIQGRFWRAVAVPLFTCWLAVDLVSFYYPASVLPTFSPVLRLLAANVLSQNTHYERVIDLVRRQSPDVFVALEVDARWRDHLEVLSDDYPHRKILARPDNFGIALFSRIPLQHASVVPLGDAGVPSIMAELVVDGKPLTIIAVHVLPPVSASRARDRNRAFEAIAAHARESSTEVVVIGDLNCTSWSPYFKDLLAGDQLRDSRRGFGLQSSWPVLPVIGPLLPIDHCLVSEGVAVHSRRVGPAIGSDHLPVAVDLSLAGKVSAP